MGIGQTVQLSTMFGSKALGLSKGTSSDGP
jgi:hypothetical protein